MKKFLSLCFATILCLSLFAVASASKYNPFADMYKQEASQLQQTGVAKNIFVVFDENKNQIKTDISITYRDQTGAIQEVVANNEGRIFIEIRKPGYIQVKTLKIANTEYEVLGKEAFEDFDYEDVLQGEVDFSVIQINANSKIAYIYDAQ